MKQTSLTVPKAKAAAKKKADFDSDFVSSFEKGLDDIRAGRIIRVR